MVGDTFEIYRYFQWVYWLSILVITLFILFITWREIIYSVFKFFVFIFCWFFGFIFCVHWVHSVCTEYTAKESVIHDSVWFQNCYDPIIVIDPYLLTASWSFAYVCILDLRWLYFDECCLYRPARVLMKTRNSLRWSWRGKLGSWNVGWEMRFMHCASKAVQNRKGIGI